MPGIVTKRFRVLNAKQFIEMYSEPEDSIYFYIGKILPWEVPEIGPEEGDNYPPQPLDSVIDSSEVWDEMVAMKKVLPGDLQLGVKRNDWAAGTVYTRYSYTDPQLHFKNWYVLTSQNQVFVCMDNQATLSGGIYVGNPSLYEPYYDSGTPSTSVINTPDGYSWKYLYTIAPTDLLKFSSPYWIPVTQNIDNDNKSTGIYSVEMKEFGTGYSAGSVQVDIVGDGQGAVAEAVVVGGQITRIDMINHGDGYTRAEVVITGGNTAEASAIANVLPYQGIGAEPAGDLGAYYVITSVTLEYGENGVIPVKNQYRQFGLIRNPVKNNLDVATESLYNMIYKLKVTTTDLFYQDEVISVNGGVATVMEFDATDPLNKMLTLVGSSVGIGVGDTLSIDTRSASVETVLDSPDLVVGSGDVLYIENVSPIYRAGDQREQFLLVCEF